MLLIGTLLTLSMLFGISAMPKIMHAIPETESQIDKRRMRREMFYADGILTHDKRE